MNTRSGQRLRSLLMALALGVAFALGATGTSVATGLTKNTVKKIAAQVIKKKSGSLDVARAAVANDASALGGRPPQAYEDDATVFNQRVLTPTTGVVLVLPLDPGDWSISWSARFTPATNSTCWVQVESTGGVQKLAEDGGTSLESQSDHSGSGVAHVGYGNSVFFHCQGTPAFTTPNDEPLQVVATPLDSVTYASLDVF